MATPSPGTLLDDLLFREDLNRKALQDIATDPEQAQFVLDRDRAANPHLGAGITPANELDVPFFER